MDCHKNDVSSQTPQRFHDVEEWNDPDPLGNQAATQFDIVNSGRDGAGGALSCGQGSVWRVQVPDGDVLFNRMSQVDGSYCGRRTDE